MGTAAELDLGKKIGREVTTVEAVARGRGKVEGNLPLVRDDSWDAAEAKTGGPVRYEIEIGRVKEVLPYAIVTEVVLTTKGDIQPGEPRVLPIDFPHFLGPPGDPVRDGMDRAGVSFSVYEAPPKVVREKRILVHTRPG
jgi:hypothetical protein